MRVKSTWLALALLLGTFGIASAAARPRSWVPPANPIPTAIDEDPDRPAGLGVEMETEAYLHAREQALELRYSGASFDQVWAGRQQAFRQLQSQTRRQGPFVSSSLWTAIGPFPIPNGQTTTISTAVSGRVSAVVVDPTDANTVYVGTAQGGVWRTTNGGTNWTPIFDGAASLAIGALALAPSDPSILYVGTGEANGSCDSYFGVGLYRIDDVKNTAVLVGPFNPLPTNNVIGSACFTGRTISQILVDAADPATVFVSTASGIGGLSCESFSAGPPVSGIRGIYRTTNGTSASPAFTKLTVTASGSIAPDATGNLIVTDMIYDPTDATGNTIVCWVNGTTTALNGGMYRTTNAKAAAPAFTQTFVTTVSNVRGLLTANRVAGVTTMLVATGESAAGTSCTTGSGCLRRSTDGGVTWSAKLAGGGGFCGGQCFYDLPVAVSPVDANVILIGGAGNGTCSRVFARSVNAGATFTGAGVADVGLHADAHAIVFAPSDPNIVYFGNDGGIFRSANGGANWTSINTAGFSATQFQSIDVHPTDANFSIGGTQDNGTNYYNPGGSWTRIDGGDGGFTVIDQNAPNTSSVTMYHTYFNQQNNLVGYARATTVGGAFAFLGNGSNGIALSELPNFYAPLVRGPGSPNTIYYGTDRLHRSADAGNTNPVVSQAPIVAGVPISTVGIAPANDNARLVGLNNGTIWGTSTGSSTLTNMTGAGMPAKYVCRVMFDPSDANTAYACFGGFGLAAGQHVWKTTNFMSGTPTWAAAGSGLPDVPVNSFAVDPGNSLRLFAGTDVGVYESADGGATWSPWTTGMPVVAVFDMAIQPTSRTLRIATHGRGMYERLIDAPVATQLALVGAEIVDGHPRMTWFSADGASEVMSLYRRAVPGDFVRVGDLTADGTGMLVYEDADVVAGRSYEYEVGVPNGANELRLGRVWVDVPVTTAFALRRLAGSGRDLTFAVSLPEDAPARVELVDVSGRRIAEAAVSGAGDHTVKLPGGAMKAGVYWARLTQAGRMVSTKVALVL